MLDVANREAVLARRLLRYLLYVLALPLHLITEVPAYKFGYGSISPCSECLCVAHYFDPQFVNLVLDDLRLDDAGDVTGEIVSQRHA